MASILAAVIMFAILFTVGTGYMIFQDTQQSNYVQSLEAASNREQSSLNENMTVSTFLESDGDIGFYVNNTSSVTINMTAALVISDTGSLLECVGIGFPAGAGCTNSTPTLPVIVDAGQGTPTIDTGYTYVSASTDLVKVLTARGNSFAEDYPEPAKQSSSTQAVTVQLDNLRWVQLIPQSSSLKQKGFVSNCNSASCSATFGSSVTAGNILVDGIGWASQSPPAGVPSDTLHDSFTLGASSSVTFTASPALSQDRYTSNCNAATCGLAFSNSVSSGDTLVYAVGWTNQAAPSSPTDTLHNTYTLGASKSATYTPPTPAVVQHRYNTNCNSATCSLAYSSAVTAGNILLYGLGWSSNMVEDYVPITITNNVGTSLSVDVSTTNDCANAKSCSVSLTTSKADELIYVAFSDSVGGNILTGLSDSAGLTWHQRAYEAASGIDQYTYYAVAPSVLSSDSISVTTNTSANLRFIVIAVIGANLAQPFDPNLSTAALNENGNSDPASVTFTTTNANDLVLAAEKTGNNAPSTGSSGYTFINCCSNTGYYANFQYKIVSSTGSFTPTFSWGNNQDSWAEIGDAIEAASSTSTPATFQEQVNWNPSTYSSYEAGDLGNIRFCADTACATMLDAWLETCSSSCTPSATTATAWIKLTSAIAGGGGSTTIYMTFGPTNLDFDDNYWGEAPTISSSYGQYDNGANVFTTYTNFAGTGTPTGWTSSGSAYTVNNGLSSASSTGSGTGGAFYTTATYGPTATQIVDAYGESSSSSCASADNNVLFGYVEGSTPGFNAVGWEADGASSCADDVASSTGANTLGSNTFGTSAYHVFSTYWGSSGRESSALDYGYFDTVYATTPSSSINVGFSIYNHAGTYHSTGPFRWVRVRAFPPAGAMPSAALGSLTAGHPIPATPTDTLGDTFTLAASTAVVNSNTAYYSYVWYTTAGGSSSDTISAVFSYTVSGTESIYELTGYTTAGGMSSTGASAAGSTSAAVTGFTPATNSFVMGNVETGSSATKYTVGSGFTTVASGSGGCDASDASQGCSEYQTGLGSVTTTPFTLSASTTWVEASVSFAPAPSVTYYSYIWYATAASSGADTISAVFGSAVAGSVSIYEFSGLSASGVLSSTGSSSTYTGSASVSSMTPASGSVVIGNTEGSSTTFTAGSDYASSGSCSSVGGCGEYETGVGSATTVPMSMSPTSPYAEAALAFAPSQTNYYSYIWYATAASSGTDTITETFGGTVAGSVSIYEITGYSATSPLSSIGSSPAGSTTASVASFSPASDSFIVGNTEGMSTTSAFTAGSGYSIDGTCSSVEGCSEYVAASGGSATTVPMTIGTSTTWTEAAMAFSTPFNPQSGIQVGGYPTLGVPSGANVAWEVTFTNVDPEQRSITLYPQSELAIGSAEYDGFDTDYTQAHYYIIDSLNPKSTTVNAYTSTTGGAFVTLKYNVPTTLYFAATQAYGSTTQAFGTNVLTPFEAYFALTGLLSDGTLYGQTIPYPYGIITESNAYTTPTVGSTGTTVTVSCTSPCDFRDSATAMVGWINSEGQFTQLTTFTTSASGNIPAGVTFQVPTAAAGYYTLMVTDYENTVFMTFQHT